MSFKKELTVCPICLASSDHIGYLEGSDEILDCEVCGAEWEETSGTITLNPKEL
jgi:hypothetical protein